MSSSKLFFALLLFFTLLACDKDDTTTSNPDLITQDTEAFKQNFGSEVSRSFLGTVVDVNNVPIEGVTISIGNMTTTTDNNGIFIINDVTVNQRFAYVIAEKAGYIHGSRALVPSSATNKLTIMLLEETVVGSTLSGTAETISMSNGASVALEGNYIKEDGSIYEGNVDVIMHFLDPTNEDMSTQMPGTLYAANLQNEERMLQTFGMLAVELRGSAGEDLNLAENSEAEITVPLDPSLVANAPSTIPLWWFDEENGYWKEDGTATLVGNAYVGVVSHFSFWNCDVPFESVVLNVQVTDIDGNPIPFTNVDLSSSNFGTISGYTNENGEVYGFVPANETLFVEVSPINNSTSCTSNLYNQNIGPFSIDSAYIVQISDYGDYFYESISGELLSCEQEPVNMGYISLNYLGQELNNTVDSGHFDFSFLRCSNDDNTFYLQGYDYANIQQTDSIAYTFTTPITNVGSIPACNTINEFIEFTVDETVTVVAFEEIGASIYNTDMIENRLYIYGLNPDIFMVESWLSPEGLILDGILDESSFVGTYDIIDNTANDTGFQLSYWIESNVENGYGPSVAVNNTTNINMEFVVSSIGEIGDYIDVSFNGEFEFQGNVHSITGSAHVIRDE